MLVVRLGSIQSVDCNEVLSGLGDLDEKLKNALGRLIPSFSVAASKVKTSNLDVFFMCVAQDSDSPYIVFEPQQDTIFST